MLDPNTYEFRSDFARQCEARGRAKGRTEGLKAGRREGRREGLREGRSEGRNEGRTEGRVELLLRQLTARFGAVSAHCRRRLRAASVDELDIIGERLLSARTLRQVLKGLNRSCQPGA